MLQDLPEFRACIKVLNPCFVALTVSENWSSFFKVNISTFIDGLVPTKDSMF
jgi:hypothetical protein